MNNADKFKKTFGIYATELWAMPESEFLKWLNSEHETPKSDPRIKGQWIDGSCSFCGCDEPMFIEDWKVEHCKTSFCPNCGADMRRARHE